MQDLIINTILSLTTGLVSGAVVTIYYRNKDAQKEKLKYLYDLRQYIWKLYIITDPLNFTYIKQIKDNYENFSFEDFLEEPKIYTWYRFTKKEKAILKNFEQINENLRSIYILTVNSYINPLKVNHSKNFTEKTKNKQELSDYRENILNIKEDITELIQKYKNL